LSAEFGFSSADWRRLLPRADSFPVPRSPPNPLPTVSFFFSGTFPNSGAHPWLKILEALASCAVLCVHVLLGFGRPLSFAPPPVRFFPRGRKSPAFFQKPNFGPFRFPSFFFVSFLVATSLLVILHRRSGRPPRHRAKPGAFPSADFFSLFLCGFFFVFRCSPSIFHKFLITWACPTARYGRRKFAGKFHLPNNASFSANFFFFLCVSAASSNRSCGPHIWKETMSGVIFCLPTCLMPAVFQRRKPGRLRFSPLWFLSSVFCSFQ